MAHSLILLDNNKKFPFAAVSVVVKNIGKDCTRTRGGRQLSNLNKTYPTPSVESHLSCNLESASRLIPEREDATYVFST